MLGVFGLFATTLLVRISHSAGAPGADGQSIFMFFPPTYTNDETMDDDLASVELLSTHDGRGASSKAFRTRAGTVSGSGNALLSGNVPGARQDPEKRPPSRSSVIAPFATPPVASLIGQLPDTSLEDGVDFGRNRSGWHRQTSPGQASSALSSQAFGTDAAEANSTYAWNLLADHLRIPANAIGSMGQATEMNSRMWHLARHDADRVLYPGVSLFRTVITRADG